MKSAAESRYYVESAAKLLDVLDSFTHHEEELSITEIAARSGLSYGSAFRLLYTLEARGYVMRPPGKKRYLLVGGRKRFRIGYAALGRIRFAKEVTWSIISAARRRGVKLIVRDNELSPAKALLNVDGLIAEKIDLLIEHQWHEPTGHLIAAKCHEAAIPVMAVTFPQPGAYYFGGNDYEAGRMAGDFLSRFVQNRWNGEAGVCYILLGEKMQSTQETRKAGMLDVLTKHLPALSFRDVLMPAPAFAPHEGYSFKRVFPASLRRSSTRMLVVALTDPLAIGAERAVCEAGLQDRAIVVGYGGAHDARSRIEKCGPFKASIAYFPDCYGELVMGLALKILDGEKAPLVTYTNHVVLTAENMPEYYPQNGQRFQRKN
jgi:ribose transport system substrate-binding protein